MHEPPESIDREFTEFRRSGDPRALLRAFDGTAPELLRVAAFLVPRDEVEDLVHDTYVAAIARDAVYDASRPLLPWLLGILANEARSRRRRARMRERERFARGPAPAPDPHDEARSHEARAALEVAMRELDADAAALLRLHLSEELSCREIAERLRRPAGTVRTQVARAMAELRRRLPIGLAVAPHFGSVDGSCLATLRARVLDGAKDRAVPVAADATRFPLTVRAALFAIAVVGVGLGTFAVWPSADEIVTAARVVADPSAAIEAPIPVAHDQTGARTSVERVDVRPGPAPWVLRGAVRSSDGAPLPTATVRFVRFQDDPATVETGVDANGRYEIDLSYWRERSAIDRGNHEFVALAAAPAHASLEHRASISLRADAAAPLVLEHDFVLAVCATVRGSVVDARGAGVAAKVLAFSADGDETLLGSALAAADGAFRIAIDGDSPRPVRIAAQHPSGARARRDVAIEPANEVDVGTIVLDTGAPVAGRLRLADGTPVANHEVSLRGGVDVDGGLPKVGPDHWYVTTRTDANGGFAATRSAIGRWSLRVGDAAGCAVDVVAAERWFGAEEHHVDVVLDAVLVQFAWWDDAGHRLLPAPTEVAVFAASAAADARAAQSGDRVARERATIASTTTRAESLLVPPGTFLWLRGNTALGSGFDRLVQVPSRSTVFPVDLRFEAAPAGRVRIVARFADGGAPAELRCEAWGEPGASARQFEVVDAAATPPGEIRGIGPVGPVRFEVAAYPPFFDNAEEAVVARLEAGADNVVTVPLQRRGRIRLWLRDSGAPDRVDAGALDGSLHTGATRLGRFFVNSPAGTEHWGNPPLGRPVDSRALLPEGVHEITIQLVGFAPTTVAIAVREGEPDTTVVWLERRDQ